jgi:hypothetical protein
MKRYYSCPTCKAPLNPNVKIILVAKAGKNKGLVLFSPQPGNYQAVVSSNLKLKSGDKVEFFCPVCGVDLTSGVNPKLAEIAFYLDNGLDGKVNFSKRFGEKATFFVTEEAVRAYGDEAARYGKLNFFGESMDKDED